jgi:hypothetical protein
MQTSSLNPSPNNRQKGINKGALTVNITELLPEIDFFSNSDTNATTSTETLPTNSSPNTVMNSNKRKFDEIHTIIPTALLTPPTSNNNNNIDKHSLSQVSDESIVSKKPHLDSDFNQQDDINKILFDLINNSNNSITAATNKDNNNDNDKHNDNHNNDNDNDNDNNNNNESNNNNNESNNKNNDEFNSNNNIDINEHDENNLINNLTNDDNTSNNDSIDINIDNNDN